jgi:hypothetical protein
MREPTRPAIPPLAGLATYAQAARVGYSVDETISLIRRYTYVERRLQELGAAFMNPTPEWEVKAALSLHMWLDAEHCHALRARVAELRHPPLNLDTVPDARLAALMDEALRARDTLELLTGIYRVLRPALLHAYRTHLDETNPIFDHPTCRLLRIAVAEEEQMIAWGEQAIAALMHDHTTQQPCQDWERHVQAYLQQAGGISGRVAIPPDLVLPSPRAHAPFVPSFEPQRDDRSNERHNFASRYHSVYNDPAVDQDERVLALMFKRLHEMDVPEVMASMLLETTGKPWDYYREMTRQLWDECRHALMGEIWFTAQAIDVRRYPNHVGWSLSLNLDMTPLERHLVLYGIEQRLMDGTRGKRYEWQLVKAADDPLATAIQDYDWADEVLHAQIGRRWLIPEAGDVKAVLAQAALLMGRASPSLDARAQLTPQIDWWPDFVRAVLGTESQSSSAPEHATEPLTSG